jgi:ABC-type bacteriocin/lantibiotic exporter with double-glycine peptidase domain
VPERDAPNCLYLLLRVYGKEVSYHDVAQCFPTGRGATLLGLKQAAEKFGLSVRMVRPTMGKDLYDRLPAIAVMDIAGTGESTFVLLHYFNKENADFISGGPVRYERVSTDDFRRSWSGVALVVDESRAGQMEMLRWTVGGLVVFLVSRLVWSVSRRAQSRRASYRVL